MRKIVVMLAAVLATCATGPPADTYVAESSPWAQSLKWTHWAAADRFQSLELIVKSDRDGVDLPIDGAAVVAEFEHGSPEECPRRHTVTGTVRILERLATQVRARVDASMKCPGEEAVAFKGDFAFDVKVPP